MKKILLPIILSLGMTAGAAVPKPTNMDAVRSLRVSIVQARETIVSQAKDLDAATSKIAEGKKELVAAEGEIKTLQDGIDSMSKENKDLKDQIVKKDQKLKEKDRIISILVKERNLFIIPLALGITALACRALRPVLTATWAAGWVGMAVSVAIPVIIFMAAFSSILLLASQIIKLVPVL